MLLKEQYKLKNITKTRIFYYKLKPLKNTIITLKRFEIAFNNICTLKINTITLIIVKK